MVMEDQMEKRIGWFSFGSISSCWRYLPYHFYP
jgi:hypothetical protein